MSDLRTLRTFAGALVLGALIACPTVPRNSFLAQPDGAPMFDLTYEPDLGLSDGKLEFELDPSRWREPVKVGGENVGAQEAVTILVEDPFGVGREVYLVRESGSRSAIPFEAHPTTTTPQPRFRGPVIVPEYSPSAGTAGGTWLHVVVGTRPEYGIKILVEP